MCPAFPTRVILHDGVDELADAQQKRHLLLRGVHLPHVEELVSDLLDGHEVRGHGSIYTQFLGLLGLSQSQVLPELLPGSAADLQAMEKRQLTLTSHWFVRLRHLEVQTNM